MDEPADLDGDGRFDAIDISILENGEESDRRKMNSGCCVPVFLFGATLIAGLGMID